MKAKRPWRRILAMFLALLLLTFIAACASKAPVGQRAASDAAGSAPMEAPAAMPAPAPMPAGEPAYDQAAKGESTGGGSAAPQQEDGGVQTPSLGDPSLQRKLILNADLGLEVTDARRAMGEIQRLAAVYRGYVADSQLSGTVESGWNARITLRMPAATFGEAYAELKKLGEVRNERQWTQDVTEEYIDLTARLKILQQHEATLVDLQTRAKTFEEWERLTYRLNDVRVQIESLQGRMRFLDNQVGYSTLNISLYQPPPGVDVKPAGPKTLGERMAEAFRDSAKAVWIFAEAMLVFVAAFLPVLGFLVVVGLVVLILVRSFRRRTPPAGPAGGPPAGPAAE